MVIITPVFKMVTDTCMIWEGCENFYGFFWCSMLASGVRNWALFFHFFSMFCYASAHFRPCRTYHIYITSQRLSFDITTLVYTGNQFRFLSISHKFLIRISQYINIIISMWYCVSTETIIRASWHDPRRIETQDLKLYPVNNPPNRQMINVHSDTSGMTELSIFP